MRSNSPIRKMSAKREAQLKGRFVRNTVQASMLVKEMKGERKCRTKRRNAVTTASIRCTTKHSRGILVRTARASAAGSKKARRAKKPNRIGSHWKRKPDVIVYADGRERCNPLRLGGKLEYLHRKGAMWNRQDGLCCICCKPLAFRDATFEHERGRNAQRIDERIWVNGLPQNGVSHELCNSERGSKRTPIYHYPQHERAA